jgi:hypothetical protein
MNVNESHKLICVILHFQLRFFSCKDKLGKVEITYFNSEVT